MVGENVVKKVFNFSNINTILQGCLLWPKVSSTYSRGEMLGFKKNIIQDSQERKEFLRWWVTCRERYWRTDKNTDIFAIGDKARFPGSPASLLFFISLRVLRLYLYLTSPHNVSGFRSALGWFFFFQFWASARLLKCILRRTNRCLCLCHCAWWHAVSNTGPQTSIYLKAKYLHVYVELICEWEKAI